jgi:ribosomal protein S18 acetylase RimI-like enzyme
MLQNALAEEARKMEIRDATADDHPSIQMLEAEIQAQHAEGAPLIFPPLPAGVIPHDQYLALLARPNERVIIAIDEGEAVGYLNYEYIDRPANYYKHPQKLVHVHVITVKATHRSRGIGEALLKYVKQRAREYGASRVTLEVYTFNTGAIRFYERVGFAPITQLMSMPLE